MALNLNTVPLFLCLLVLAYLKSAEGHRTLETTKTEQTTTKTVQLVADTTTKLRSSEESDVLDDRRIIVGVPKPTLKSNGR